MKPNALRRAPPRATWITDPVALLAALDAGERAACAPTRAPEGDHEAARHEDEMATTDLDTLVEDPSGPAPVEPPPSGPRLLDGERVLRRLEEHEVVVIVRRRRAA
jgi:hypothetical protein